VAGAARDLPDGAMIARRARPYAVRGASLAPWNFSGYGAPLALEPAALVNGLTPPSTSAALAGGFRPMQAQANR
jgi:hypothetical protein